jgi:mycofactocin system glycosyltransferase
VLTGGSPWRMLRISARADRLVDAWSVGVPVADRPAPRRFAARLVDAGLAHPRPGPAGDAATTLTVVIPVHDRPDGLAATLSALDPHDDVVVVDDASADPDATARVVATRPGTRLARRGVRGGPGAARNTGWRQARSATAVAFLDADCLPEPGSPARLARYFSDPSLVAIAARVVPVGTSGGTLDAYEQVRSPLDLGGVPAPVGPGSRVSYVPAAALVVRRSALESLGGFDEDLRTGEDVDLVWRLGRLGRVRYEPSVTVGHPVRPGWLQWAAQRYDYGRSAAPLAERHGSAAAPLTIGPGAAAAWVLVVTGRRRWALGVALGVALAASGGRPATLRDIGLRVVVAEARAAPAIAEALRRSWWPLAVVAAALDRRARRWVALAAIGPALYEWWSRKPPGIGPGRFVACRLADDLAYGTGVWAGVLGCHSRKALRCLLPARPARRARSVTPGTT